MELRGRWWNGRFGRIARQDIWLYDDGGGWVLQARGGDSDDPKHEWRYADEAQARNAVRNLIDESGLDGWKDTTSLYGAGTN